MAFMEKVKRFAEWLEHGKTVVEIIAALGGGKVFVAVLTLFTKIPPIWMTPIWLLSSAAILWILLKLLKPKPAQLQSTVQSGSIIPKQPAVDFDATEYFRTAYYSPLTAEVEKNIRLAATQNQPNDREGFFAKVIGVGLISYLHDITWAYIYKSQILMLMELNRRNGIMPLADAKVYYNKATVDYPLIYSHYLFDQWMSFMKAHQLLIHHPSDMLEVTVRGKDFLKYLTHWGLYPDARWG